MMPVQTILHPTDFSSASEPAFRLACTLAREHHARLILLHVAEPSMLVGGEGVPIFPVGFDLEPLRQQLKQLQPDGPSIPVEHLLAEGEAAMEILAVAAAKHCDMIVMGTHGRSGLRRLLMGSVAEQIVRRAPCPVLTVKAPPQPAPAAKESVAAAT